MSKFISDVKELKMKKIVKSIWQLIINIYLFIYLKLTILQNLHMQ